MEGFWHYPSILQRNLFNQFTAEWPGLLSHYSALLANEPVVDVTFNQSLVSNGSQKVLKVHGFIVGLAEWDWQCRNIVSRSQSIICKRVRPGWRKDSENCALGLSKQVLKWHLRQAKDLTRLIINHLLSNLTNIRNLAGAFLQLVLLNVLI